LDEAEKLQVEVMEKEKEALGEGHPSTLTSIVNLAFMLRVLGRRQSASKLISSCVVKSSDVLGVDHPDARAYWRLKTQWEKEDILPAGEEAVGSTADKPADGGAKMIQFLRIASAPRFILAGIVVVMAILLRQYLGR
jgi:hypothetical protein